MRKYYKYRARSGDTFDMLAIAFYNNEKLATLIIESNPQYSGTVVFDAGVLLYVPVLEKEDNKPDTIAPWRRQYEGIVQ